MTTETLTALNAHNLLPAHVLISGQCYADETITAENACAELTRVCDLATTPRLIRAAMALTIGAGNNGDVPPSDVLDILDYLCARLAA